MDRKDKSLNNQYLYLYNKMFCGIKSYNTCSNGVPTIVFPLVCCPVDDTLFEVGPEIRSSGVSNRYCCYGNHTAGSKPI